MPKEPQKPRQSKRINQYARFSAIAFQMIAIIGIGTWGGIALDKRYPNDYFLFTLFLSLLSVAIAMVYLVRQARRMTKN